MRVRQDMRIEGDLGGKEVEKSMLDKFCVFAILMMLYCLIGWAYESTVFSLCEQGKFMNRGYFIGPYCPIYGVGFFASLYLMGGITSTFKLVMVSAMVCTGIEYITSYVLEKRFDARYWDYYYYPLNINGRVSVPSSLFFGIAITFFIKVGHPFFYTQVLRIPQDVRLVMGIVFLIIFLLDAGFTFISMCNLNRKCRELYDAWDGYVEDKLDILNEKKDKLERFVVVRKGQEILVKAKNVNRKFLEIETRYLRRPGFKSVKYSALTDKIKLMYKPKFMRVEDEIWYQDIADEADDDKADEPMIEGAVLTESTEPETESC